MCESLTNFAIGVGRKERERAGVGRETLHLLAYSSNVIAGSLVELSQSWELGIQSGSPLWVTGAQFLEPLLL